MLKLTKGVMFIALFASTILLGCEKDEGELTKETVAAPNVEKIKFQKMVRFISIMWIVPEKEVLFDENKQEFSFREVKININEIESLYDVSNEYKFKYEK